MQYETIQINENTWRIEDGFVRFFLLTGTESALLIDSGASGTGAKEAAMELTKLPIRLLNTHGDGDHTAGNGEFSEFLIHPEDYALCGMQAKYPESTPVPLHDGDILDLGNRKLEIIAIPGHTYGSVAVLDTDNRLLFSGDSVQDGTIFMFGSHRAPDVFSSSLRRLSALTERFDTIHPSHGTPELSPVFISSVLSAWEQVQSGALIPTRQNLFGTEVEHYAASSCGFYCSPK